MPGRPPKIPPGWFPQSPEASPEKPSSQVPELQGLGRQEVPAYLIETTRRVTGKATYPDIQVSAYPDAMMRSAMRARLHSPPISFPSGSPAIPSLSLPASLRLRIPACPSGSPSLPGSSRSAGSLPLPACSPPVLLLFLSGRILWATANLCAPRRFGKLRFDPLPCLPTVQSIFVSMKTDQTTPGRTISLYEVQVGDVVLDHRPRLVKIPRTHRYRHAGTVIVRGVVVEPPSPRTQGRAIVQFPEGLRSRDCQFITIA